MLEKNKVALENVNIIYIDDEFVEEIAKTIKNDLISMCWGEENKDMFNYEQTVTSFLERITDRDSAFKAGFVGEFLVHCYFKTFINFKHLSVFFSDQDRSNKRGFDYMIYDNKKGLWYVEIKSGTEKNNELVNTFNKNKIQEAYRDCEKKFIAKNNLNLWNVAKSEVGKVISKNSTLRKKVKDILEADMVGGIDNVILASVVFNDSMTKVTNINELNNLREKYKSHFGKITFLCFRKKTVERIINLIKGDSYEQ